MTKKCKHCNEQVRINYPHGKNSKAIETGHGEIKHGVPCTKKNRGLFDKKKRKKR